MAASTQQRASLFSLSALVVGPMTRAGILSLPRTVAAATGRFGAIIA
jgi:arginine:ornithine antiporter / lysine permease